jgi:hypothetical protein
MGLSEAEMEAAYREGKAAKLTAYLMGWVVRILRIDSSASLEDPALPQRLLGAQYEQSPEYLRGFEDARSAAEVILEHSS